MHAVAAEYHQSTLKGTLTCSSHTGIVLCETYVVGQGESGCVCFIQYEWKTKSILYFPTYYLYDRIKCTIQ